MGSHLPPPPVPPSPGHCGQEKGEPAHPTSPRRKNPVRLSLRLIGQEAGAELPDAGAGVGGSCAVLFFPRKGGLASPPCLHALLPAQARGAKVWKYCKFSQLRGNKQPGKRFPKWKIHLGMGDGGGQTSALF